MKSRNILRHSIATLLSLAAASHAASLTWDGGPLASTTDDIITAGAGTWMTGLNNWDDGIANLVNAPWANGDDAVFAGTAGIVTISGGGVIANSLTFNSAYTISGNALTLGGATPTISANGILGVLSSSISGSNGLTLATTGATAGVYLDGSNTYTGVTSATSGFLVARNAGSLGGSADGTVVASGATLQIEGNGAVNVHYAIPVGTGTTGGRQLTHHPTQNAAIIWMYKSINQITHDIRIITHGIGAVNAKHLFGPVYGSVPQVAIVAADIGEFLREAQRIGTLLQLLFCLPPLGDILGYANEVTRGRF